MIILTGAAGFIGSVVLWQLNQAGYQDIWLVDNLANTTKWKNLTKRSFLGYTHKADFQSWLTNVNKTKIDAVIHLGACSDTSQMDMDYLYKNNVLFSQILFEYCTNQNIPLIYASSAATYGDGDQGYEDNPQQLHQLRPMNPYGYSKHLFDLWVQKQTRTPPLWVGFKFFNVYGPNEYHKGDMMSLVAKSRPQIEKDGYLKLFKSYKPGIGHGEQKRDFIYVKDVSNVILHTLANFQRVQSGIYNLGSGKARSFADLGRAVFKAMEKPEQFEWIEMPDVLKTHYQYLTQATLENLRKGLGYEKNFYDLEAGVKDYVQNFLLKPDMYL